MPRIDEELQPYIADLVKNAMLTKWNDICADTQCHPLDIEQNFEGQPGHLGFSPRHWAQEFFAASRKERTQKIGRFVMTGQNAE